MNGKDTEGLLTLIKTWKETIILFSDAVLLSLAFALSYYIRFDFSMSGFPAGYMQSMPYLLAATLVVKLLVFKLFRLYQSVWKYASIYEFLTVVIAAALCNIIFFTFIIFVRVAPLSIYPIMFMLDVFVIGGSRLFYRIYRNFGFQMPFRIDRTHHVLIVGAGEAGVQIAKEMYLHPELESKPVAYVDNNMEKIGKVINGVPVLGDLNDMQAIIEKKRVDRIIIAIPSARPAVLNDIYEQCSDTKCEVKILPSMWQLIDGSVMMQKVKDVAIEDLLGRDAVHVDLQELCGYLQGKTVLVTGGGGSIGSELCAQIASYCPQKLIVLDNYENNLYWVENTLRHVYPNIEVETVVANIREPDRIDEIFRIHRPDIVYHAAAHKHVPFMEEHPCEAVKNNVFGTWNVAYAAHKHQTDRFVLISTDKAVNPTNVMGATKRIAEMIVQTLHGRSRTEYSAVRFGNVLGSNASVIPIFQKQIEEGGPVQVTHPDVTRFFMTIPEAVQLVLQAAAMAEGGEIFVLDMGEPIKILDLAKNMIRLSGFTPYEDIDIEIIGLRPGEKLYEELLMQEEDLQKTKNQKIFIAQPIPIDYGTLKQHLDRLKDDLKTCDDNEQVKIKIQSLVPTYKNNGMEKAAASS